MKRGICPKCQGNNIYWKDPIKGTNDDRSHISVKGSLMALVIEIYICGDCGYLEEYADPNQKRMNLVKQVWNKV